MDYIVKAKSEEGREKQIYLLFVIVAIVGIVMIAWALVDTLIVRVWQEQCVFYIGNYYAYREKIGFGIMMVMLLLSVVKTVLSMKWTEVQEDKTDLFALFTYTFSIAAISVTWCLCL